MNAAAPPPPPPTHTHPLLTKALPTVSLAAVISHPPLYFKPSDWGPLPPQWTPLSLCGPERGPLLTQDMYAHAAATASWCQGKSSGRRRGLTKLSLWLYTERLGWMLMNVYMLTEEWACLHGLCEWVSSPYRAHLDRNRLIPVAVLFWIDNKYLNYIAR